MKLYKDEDWGNFSHPTEGYDITITKEGAGKNTEYSVMGKPNSKLLHKDATVMKRWIEGQHPLARYIAIPSDAEIAMKCGVSEAADETVTAGGKVYDMNNRDDDTPF